MRAGPVLLVSALAHGLVLLLVAPSRRAPRQAKPLAPPPAPHLETPPVEVALLDPERTAESPQTPRSGGSKIPSLATSGLGVSGALAVDPSSGDRVDRSGLMHMRNGTDLGLDADVAE